MRINYVELYIACAAAWIFIETQLSIRAFETNENHWLQRAMRGCRNWASRQSRPVSVAGRIIASIVLALVAWIPVLLVSLCWPVTVTIYILCNLRNKD
ncbi:hypothetical protein D7B12_18040 [Salmonella enterica]|nr:hypothetical protein [Salmonella enterica]